MNEPSQFLTDFSAYISIQDAAVIKLILATLGALALWAYLSRAPGRLTAIIRKVYAITLMAVYLAFTAYLWSTL